MELMGSVGRGEGRRSARWFRIANKSEVIKLLIKLWINFTNCVARCRGISYEKCREKEN